MAKVVSESLLSRASELRQTDIFRSIHNRVLTIDLVYTRRVYQMIPVRLESSKLEGKAEETTR